MESLNTNENHDVRSAPQDITPYVDEAFVANIVSTAMASQSIVEKFDLETKTDDSVEKTRQEVAIIRANRRRTIVRTQMGYVFDSLLAHVDAGVAVPTSGGALALMGGKNSTTVIAKVDRRVILKHLFPLMEKIVHDIKNIPRDELLSSYLLPTEFRDLGLAATCFYLSSRTLSKTISAALRLSIKCCALDVIQSLLYEDGHNFTQAAYISARTGRADNEYLVVQDTVVSSSHRRSGGRNKVLEVLEDTTLAVCGEEGRPIVPGSRRKTPALAPKQKRAQTESAPKEKAVPVPRRRQLPTAPPADTLASMTPNTSLTEVEVETVHL